MASMLVQRPRSNRPLRTSRAWWTRRHILFALSTLGRLAVAGLSLRLHDPGAPGDVHARVRVLVERTGITAAVGSFRKNPRAACL